MLLAKFKAALLRNYNQSKDSNVHALWPLTHPAIICACSKTDRLANPFIGIIPRSNLYSTILASYCRQCNPLLWTNHNINVGTPRLITLTALKIKNKSLLFLLKNLCSFKIDDSNEAIIEYRASVLTHEALFSSNEAQELLHFILSLSSFLNGCYTSTSTHIEPFQKQLIMHTFYFLVSVKCPKSTNELFNAFQEYFGLFRAEMDLLHTFKQKASVFLIPRRHGKTWIVVAIISMLLATIENIHIGYVAHQKHVATSVFTEILNTLYKHFPAQNVDVKKEHGTIIYRSNNKKPSTLMCATCFNKNVSKHA